MKKNFFYAMMSAIALTSAVSFTACSSDDGVAVENNPTYDGTSVRTDFAFSITKASQGTRMTAADVQESTSQSFLGVKEMFLLPFNGVPGTATTTNASPFYLGSLTTADINDDVIGREGTKSSKVYSLTLPIHTNNFLFYGIADNSKTNFEQGSITRKGLTVPTTNLPASVDISGISFELNNIQSSLGEDSARIARYLNAIANTENWAGTVDQAKTNSAYKGLADLYTKYISVNAPRAGSAEAVTRTVLDLYRSALKINNESSVSAIKTIATAICTSITTQVENAALVTIDTSNSDANQWTASISGLADSKFPSGELNLPMGAAQLVWTGTEFDYNENPLQFGPTSDNKAVGKYRYPAELIYFDNSPLRASEQYRSASDYPESAANWDVANATVTGNSGFNTTIWNKDEVTPGTRAVAMQNNVNYGVALLQTNVKLGEITSGHEGFTDNRKAVLGTSSEDDQTNIDATKMSVTGILIGGQPRSVKWDMTNPNDDFDDVIYDKAVAFEGNLKNTNYAKDNYTIVLDNYNNKNATTAGEAGDQKTVRFALEIKNGDQDFYGTNGIIPAGCTFYLVGEMKPQSPTTAYEKPSYHSSDYRLTKEGVQRVFMQDYKTIANITISDDALKNAYSTIPDLRSTEIVFGLSVDLKWEAGVQFDIEL